VARKRQSDYGTGIPRHEIELLAKTLLPLMRTYLESEEGKQAFALWQQEKQKEKQEKKPNN